MEFNKLFLIAVTVICSIVLAYSVSSVYYTVRLMEGIGDINSPPPVSKQIQSKKFEDVPAPPDNPRIAKYDFTGKWTKCSFSWSDSCEDKKIAKPWLYLEINNDKTYTLWELYGIFPQEGKTKYNYSQKGTWSEEWTAIWEKDAWKVSNVIIFQPSSGKISDMCPWTIDIKNGKLTEIYEYEDGSEIEEYLWEKE